MPTGRHHPDFPDLSEDNRRRWDANARWWDDRIGDGNDFQTLLIEPATERLLETMAELKRQGVAQIIISHRMTDIFEVGDRIMVLKRGQNVGDRYITQTSEKEVLELIVSGTPDTALTAEEAAKQAA